MWKPPSLDTLNEKPPLDDYFDWSIGWHSLTWKARVNALILYRLAGVLLLVTDAFLVVRMVITHALPYFHWDHGGGYWMMGLEVSFCGAIITGANERFVQPLVPLRAFIGCLLAADLAFSQHQGDEALRQLLIAVALIVLSRRRSSPLALKAAWTAMALCAVTSGLATLMAFNGTLH